MGKASVLVLWGRRKYFHLFFKKIRHTVRSLRNCSRKIRAGLLSCHKDSLKARNVCHVYHELHGGKGPFINEQNQRKLPGKASIHRQDSIATNFSSCYLWGRSDEDVEWNVTFCLRYLMNYRESSFIRNSSTWEPAWILWPRTCFVPFAETIHQIPHSYAQHEE